ncbi:MAG: ribosome maturation factor RimM [Zhenhengia sp.]|jgi:16S rRNA processing protein RimM|uniref:ribosome maturation factor RimM n=1 Tax=Zhenhengia sp. TaxID=2944208 RepID=UPI0029089760|nr:ribosome maturation factor RimM [Clostridiales bacterium]MDU6974248.1 ribosome maturation factor RimM [Clostridiales bacterium]
MEQMFTIGKIVNTHGVKGEVRVLPSTDDVKRFGKLKEVKVENRTMTTYEIETVRYHKNFVLLKFKGIDTMNEAELLKNSLLKIDRKDALPLKKDEYYQCDLYGLRVVTDIGRDLGKLTDILMTGSNDVYVVRNEEKEILIPAIKQCILKVDLEAGEMLVHLLEGLED